MQKLESLSSTTVQVIDFVNGQDEYAIEIKYITEIINFRDLASVPGAPHFIEGVVDLRGKVIPVINLKKRLGKGKENESSLPGHILIVKIKDLLVGVCVEKVLEVSHISIEKIQMAPEILKRGDVNFLKGFCKISDRLILLLDPDLFLNDREKEMLLKE